MLRLQYEKMLGIEILLRNDSMASRLIQGSIYQLYTGGTCVRIYCYIQYQPLPAPRLMSLLVLRPLRRPNHAPRINAPTTAALPALLATSQQLLLRRPSSTLVAQCSQTHLPPLGGLFPTQPPSITHTRPSAPTLKHSRTCQRPS